MTNYDKLLRLGYSKLWLDIGILTMDNLDAQIKQLDSGQDDNTEHYRYQTFIKYFNQQPSFDNNTLKQILQLLQSDSDQTMASSATVSLLKKLSLTNEQFDTVANFLKTFGAWTTKQIDYARQQRTTF